MKDLEIRFEGNPDKFGSAAYCDLVYTESKLCDNILFKNLINFKQTWTYKTQSITLQALYDHISDILHYKLTQKQCLIETQQQQINFLQQKNQQLITKNLQRTRKLLRDHKQTIFKLLKQKEEQVLVIQGQKQLLQERIDELQKEATRKVNLVNSIEEQRQSMLKRHQQLQQANQEIETKLKLVENQLQQLIKEHRLQVSQLNDEKLQLQLKHKKLMIEQAQQHKHQMEQLQKLSEEKLQLMQQQRMKQNLQGKNLLNSTIDYYESLINQNKLKTVQLQSLTETLSKQVEFQRQRNQSLTNDINKQDQILDNYQSYLKNADQNILNLKQLLMQLQTELENDKHSLQKSLIEKDSLYSRIKISQQQAKMWRQSYYLNKSRTQANDN